MANWRQSRQRLRLLPWVYCLPSLPLSKQWTWSGRLGLSPSEWCSATSHLILYHQVRCLLHWYASRLSPKTIQRMDSDFCDPLCKAAFRPDQALQWLVQGCEAVWSVTTWPICVLVINVSVLPHGRVIQRSDCWFTWLPLRHCVRLRFSKSRLFFNFSLHCCCVFFGLPWCPHCCSPNTLPQFKWTGGLAILQQLLIRSECRLRQTHLFSLSQPKCNIWQIWYAFYNFFQQM